MILFNISSYHFICILLKKIKYINWGIFWPAVTKIRFEESKKPYNRFTKYKNFIKLLPFNKQVNISYTNPVQRTIIREKSAM